MNNTKGFKEGALIGYGYLKEAGAYSIFEVLPRCLLDKGALNTAWKVCKYGVFSDRYFPIFGLNTEIYSINLRIQSEYRKIRTSKNSVSGYFSQTVTPKFILFIWNSWSFTVQTHKIETCATTILVFVNISSRCYALIILLHLYEIYSKKYTCKN